MPESNAPVQVEWMLLADYALVDQAGKLSILGIFRGLQVFAFPAAHPAAYVVTAFVGEPLRTVACEFRVWTPSKELLLAGQQQAQLGPDGRANGVAQIAPLPFPIAGTYVFEILVDGIGMRQVEVLVEQIPSQNQ